MHGHEKQPDDPERERDDVTDDQVDDEMLLEALVNRQLPAHLAIGMCQRLEVEPDLRKQLANIVSSQALLASVLDPNLRPTTPECDFARARFGAYADQTLAHGDISVFSAHLQACSLCQLGFEAFELEREDAARGTAKRPAAQPVRTGELSLAAALGARSPVAAAPAMPNGRHVAPAPAAGGKPAGLRAGALAAACVAVAVTAFASGRWTAGGPPAAGNGNAAGVVAGAAATGRAEIVTPATSPPDLAAAVAELLAMSPWTAEQRAALAPLADANLGSEARRVAIEVVVLSGHPAPESLGWALGACEASPVLRTRCYALRNSGGVAGAVDVSQGLRALERDLAAGDYLPAGAAMAALTRASSTAGLRAAVLDVLGRAARGPAECALDTHVASRSVNMFPGDQGVRAAVDRLTAHADARVRVLGLGALVEEAARMHDDSAREAGLLRVAPYLIHSDDAVAKRARVPFLNHAMPADLAAALAVVGPTPPPYWAELCEAVAKRVALVVG